MMKHNQPQTQSQSQSQIQQNKNCSHNEYNHNEHDHDHDHNNYSNHNHNQNYKDCEHCLYYDRQLGIVWKQLPIQLYYPYVKQGSTKNQYRSQTQSQNQSQSESKRSLSINLAKKTQQQQQKQQYQQQICKTCMKKHQQYKTRILEEGPTALIINYIQQHTNTNITPTSTTIIEIYDINPCQPHRTTSVALRPLTRTKLKPSLSSNESALILNQMALMDVTREPTLFNRAEHRQSAELFTVLRSCLIIFVSELMLPDNHNPQIMATLSKQHSDGPHQLISNDAPNNKTNPIYNLIFPTILLPFLQQLNLSGNSIQSIDGLLSAVSAPWLAKLELSNNHITCLRNLHRLTNSSPKLQIFYLLNNKITDMHDGHNRNLIASAMSQLGFRDLNIEYFSTSSINCGNSLFWLVKCGLGSEERGPTTEYLDKFQQQSSHQQKLLPIFCMNSNYQKWEYPYEFERLSIESKSRIGGHTRTIKQKLHKKYSRIKIKVNIVLPRVPPMDYFNF